jgi:5-(carboxyamino)imidazole ribonucleotide synthase
MMGDAAHAVGVHLTVLATSRDDAAVQTCDEVIFGDPRDADALARLARSVDVVTFDHELVDLEQVRSLEDVVTVRPRASALALAVDKAHQRRTLAAAGIAVPRHLIVARAEDPLLETYLDSLEAPPVIKSARGGYDGRGVTFTSSRDDALRAVAAIEGDAVVEERLDLLAELSQVLVRDVEGHVALYPLVTTIQCEGMCVETIYPAASDFADEAAQLATRIAELGDVVGVLAVELFVTASGLVVNEVALRPHNTGHWTIEGAATSQFANHLLAVSGQRLGATTPTNAAVVMVNVVGGPQPASSTLAARVKGAHVHDYGKSWRPGRKLGHVTVCAADVETAHVRAWESARAYGTSTREA